MLRSLRSAVHGLRTKSAWRLWARQQAPMWCSIMLLVVCGLALVLTWQSSSGGTGSPATVLPGRPPANPLIGRHGIIVAPPVKPLEESVQPNSADVQALQAKVDSYDPRTAVAFAIPVGGRTQRAKQLSEILSNLLEGGAAAENVFVMEDVLGRPGGVNSPEVAEVARAAGVRVVSSHVGRQDLPEDGTNFGIHLARHYKFMLDFLLVGPEAAGAKGAADIQAGAGAPFEFAVLIEDDLVLAPDFVKYFLSMSRVMRVDPTLYCVSAHNDNAFYGTSWEPDSGSLMALDGLGFDFRRGNHFMAPGWMTSREIYRGVVRDMWLDPLGQYAFKDQLHLRNGHWDRFFDSLTGARDCIFPDIPRIIHQGADGFTVSQRAQMELYSNLRLSQLSPLVDYGDLHRLTKDGYVQSIVDFIAGASRLSALEESRSYRLSHLVYIVPAVDSDKDDNWNEVLNGFFGLIGVGGYGGFEGYVKLRGVFQGTVMVRWTNNLILLVGAYSPFLVAAQKLPVKLDYALSSAGCFSDLGADRDLPHHLAYYTPLNLSPRACLTSCIHEGFKYAGLQAGMECWCGNTYGKHGQPDTAGSSGACTQQCGPGLAPTALLKSSTSSPNKPRAMALLAPPSNAKNDPVSCGGAWSNSIYSNGAAPTMHEDVLRAPKDALFVTAGAGQSCTEACGSPAVRTKALGKSVRCIEGLFPLLHRSCPILKALIGCTSCVEEEDMVKGVYSPGGFNGRECRLSKGRYIRCAAKPDPLEADYRRACVCELKEKK